MCNLRKSFQIPDFTSKASHFFFYGLNPKRNLVLTCAWSHAQPAAAYLSRLHTWAVYSIRHPHCRAGETTAARYKSAIRRRHISLNPVIVFCSKVEFALRCASGFQRNLQPVLREKEFRLLIFKFSVQYLFYLFFQSGSPDHPWNRIYVLKLLYTTSQREARKRPVQVIFSLFFIFWEKHRKLVLNINYIEIPFEVDIWKHS